MSKKQTQTSATVVSFSGSVVFRKQTLTGNAILTAAEKAGVDTVKAARTLKYGDDWKFPGKADRTDPREHKLTVKKGKVSASFAGVRALQRALQFAMAKGAPSKSSLLKHAA